MIDGIKNIFCNITKLNKRQICESIHPMSHSDVYQILKQTSNDLEFLRWYSVFDDNFSSYEVKRNISHIISTRTCVGMSQEIFVVEKVVIQNFMPFPSDHSLEGSTT